MATSRNCRNDRILFVATSGVRVVDQELLDLGLTLPGFVERSRAIASLPSLGLLTLADCTPPDWQMDYREFDQQNPEAFSRQVLEDGFDLVAISTLSARAHETFQLADLLRREGIAVVIGGLHASALPHETKVHADAVIIGEGEPVWGQVLEDFRDGQLRPFYRAEAADRVFDRHVIPRFDLLDPKHYDRLTLQTTRGCPIGCSFCGASRLISPYRKKAQSQIRSELEAILAIWPRPFIELADDNTFLDKTWSRDLARTLGDYPAKWFTETDISFADDPELLELCAAAGCRQVLIGLESGSRQSLLHADRSGWKERRRDNYRDSVSRIQSAGISVNGCFVLGFDGETPHIFEETLELIDSLNLAEAQITLLTPFPGTALTRTLEAEGRLFQPVDWSCCTLFDLMFEPSDMTAQELRSGFRWLMQEVYSDPRVKRRNQTFRASVRAAAADR